MLDNEKSVDVTTEKILKVADKQNISTVFDRYEAMEPECGFGQLGICCRNCVMGPCRIDPFAADDKHSDGLGSGAREGICGATADIIAARNLVRMIAAGASAHSDHGRDVACTLLETSKGKTKGYGIKGKEKLLILAK